MSCSRGLRSLPRRLNRDLCLIHHKSLCCAAQGTALEAELDQLLERPVNVAKATEEASV
jgi:hypothetical protein